MLESRWEALEAVLHWDKYRSAWVADPGVNSVYCHFEECWHRIIDRSPCCPPRASCALSSFPRTQLIMWGVQVLAPTRSSVRQASIFAMSLQSPV